MYMHIVEVIIYRLNFLKEKRVDLCVMHRLYVQINRIKIKHDKMMKHVYFAIPIMDRNLTIYSVHSTKWNLLRQNI